MKETLIQSAIETYLGFQENLGKLVFIKNNSGAYKTAHGSFVRFGKAGSPDFFVFLPGEIKVIHLEVKNEKGQLNANQKEYKNRIEKIGHQYVVVRGVDEVENLIKGKI